MIISAWKSQQIWISKIAIYIWALITKMWLWIMIVQLLIELKIHKRLGRYIFLYVAIIKREYVIIQYSEYIFDWKCAPNLRATSNVVILNFVKATILQEMEFLRTLSCLRIQINMFSRTNGYNIFKNHHFLTCVRYPNL